MTIRSSSSFAVFVLPFLLVTMTSCTTTSNDCSEPDAGIPDAGPDGGEPDGGIPGELDEMTAAFLNYLEVTREVTLELRESASFEGDPVGMIDIMTGMMQANLRTHMSSSAAGFRGRPRWGAFDDPNTRLGVDNPDTRYLSAHIPNVSGENIYRVWGNRGSSVDWILLSNDASNPMGGGATLEDEDMVNLDGNPLQLNEDYEVYLSTADLYDDSYMDNWLEVQTASALNISSRYTMCNYVTERPGDIFVERLGTEGVAITAEEYRVPEIMIEQIATGTAVMENQQPFWAGFADLITAAVEINTLPTWRATAGLGIQTQLNSTGWGEVADDEALVVSFAMNTPADYGGLQLFNAWGSSLPWGHVMANMSWGCDGGANSIPTSDGLTHIVISKQDPGVHNWIDTMGFERIYIAARLQSVDPDERDNLIGGAFAPQTQLVKLNELMTVLPDDTATVTPEERAQQIAIRQRYQRDKYAPW